MDSTTYFPSNQNLTSLINSSAKRHPYGSTWQIPTLSTEHNPELISPTYHSQNRLCLRHKLSFHLLDLQNSSFQIGFRTKITNAGLFIASTSELHVCPTSVSYFHCPDTTRHVTVRDSNDGTLHSSLQRL
jgi:hypothetical protein